MKVKGRQPLLLLLLLGFGKAFVSAAAASRHSLASHWLQEYSTQSTDVKTLWGRGLNITDPDPLKRKIDWVRLNEVVFGSDNVVEVVTTGVATKVVVIAGYLLAGESWLTSELSP